MTFFALLAFFCGRSVTHVEGVCCEKVESFVYIFGTRIYDLFDRKRQVNTCRITCNCVGRVELGRLRRLEMVRFLFGFPEMVPLKLLGYSTGQWF